MKLLILLSVLVATMAASAVPITSFFERAFNNEIKSYPEIFIARCTTAPVSQLPGSEELIEIVSVLSGRTNTGTALVHGKVYIQRDHTYLFFASYDGEQYDVSDSSCVVPIWSYESLGSLSGKSLKAQLKIIFRHRWEHIDKEFGGWGPERERLSALLQETYLGAPTNGLMAAVSIQYDTNQPPHVKAVIYVHQDFDTNSVPLRPTSPDFLKMKSNWIWDKTNLGSVYFLATNAFPGGVIELRDQDGNQISSLKPKEDFCDFYDRRYLGEDGPFKRRLAEPALGPRPRLGAFDVNDFFKITKSGEYTLTVWAKIYKQVSEEYGLCQRIDLPPVTIPIKCESLKEH